MSQPRRVIRIVSALATTIVLSFIALQQTNADIGRFIPTWRMIGHDITNTRSQPFEPRIFRRNVDHLSPRWTFTTAGDVSATPAVDNEADEERGRGHRRLVLYFPDWGGVLWKLDAETGKILWSRDISEYNNIADSISRTSPALARGLVLVADLNGNMMGIDAATGDLRWLTRTRSQSQHDRHDLTGRARQHALYCDLVLRWRRPAPHFPRKHDRARHPHRTKNLADLRTAGQRRRAWRLRGRSVCEPASDRCPERPGVRRGGSAYAEPASVTACLAAAPGGWSESCYPAGAYFNSVVAFDMETGTPRWSFRGAGPRARELGCGPKPPAWCPPWENNFSVGISPAPV